MWRAVDPFAKEKQVAVYMRYVREQQGGYPGTFNEYLADRGLTDDVLPVLDKAELDAAARFAAGEEDEEAESGDEGPELDFDAEEPVAKDVANGPFIDATYDSMLANSPWTTMLGAEPEDPHALVGVELLLGTLEALHIDNARIEVEGGNEARTRPTIAARFLEASFSKSLCLVVHDALVLWRLCAAQPRAEELTRVSVQIPALDGSAQPWLDHIETAGIRPASKIGGGPEDCVRKFAWRPSVRLSPLAPALSQSHT